MDIFFMPGNLIRKLVSRICHNKKHVTSHTVLLIIRTDFH